jgi:predicted AAA+ superfamily ATPase
MLHTFVSWKAAKHDTICTHQRAPLRRPALRPICNLRKKSEGNLAGSSLFIQLCRTVLLCPVRDKDKKEVDLLIHKDGTLYPIEIKKSASPDKKAVRHFKTLQTLKLPIGPGCVLSLAPTRLPLSESVQAVPMGML